MLELGQLVVTTDGHSGRLVNAITPGSWEAHEFIDDDHVPVRSVLLPGGEVRWYADTALRPLTLNPVGTEQSAGAPPP